SCATDEGGDIRDNRDGNGGKADSPTGPRVNATWSIHSVANVGGVSTCPAGFDTVAVYSQRVDSINIGATVDLFNCSDRAGTTSPVPPGRYYVWMAVVNHAASTTYSQTTAVTADVTQSGAPVNFDILTDGGYFSVKWSLVGALSNATLNCE